MRFAALSGLFLFAACSTTGPSAGTPATLASIPIPAAWQVAPPAAAVPDICAVVTCTAKPVSNVRIEGGRIFNGDKELTPQFVAIQSFDVSLERKEVVFSAKRKDNFDIGLVSLDGSDVHWVPEDRADETDVQWAPRGNKVSFVVKNAGGELIRSVHIPTASQLSADFPYSIVRRLVWEPAAERYAIVVETPDSSPRVESLRYNGEERKVIAAPALRLDVALEPFAGGVMLRPSAMRYSERIPMAVWIDPQPFAWSDARASLLRERRMGEIVVSRLPDQAFWDAVRTIPWVDHSRLYLVGAPSPGPVRAITGDASVAPGSYVLQGNTVLVAPADVQSFAARYIADQLKGTTPPNGR